MYVPSHIPFILCIYKVPHTFRACIIQERYKKTSLCILNLERSDYFDKFQRDLFITAKPHDVSEILDPTFTPGPSTEEKELFEAKQVFMYKVFN